ncbi:MAG: hypothetical protein U5R06_22615 [candidate division KSB1 bacterium]|nr:hypothetical protein [candidate division KSB1 bacterium]
MNFTISRTDLNNALHKVVGVVPQKTTIGILTCILTDWERGQNRVAAGTDLEISVTHTLQVDAEEGGVVAIPAKMLQEIVKELPDIPINVSSIDGEKILLKTEMGEYKISTQPKEDFPHINIEESEQEFKINGNILNRLTAKDHFLLFSTDELRPALTRYQCRESTRWILPLWVQMATECPKSFIKNFRLRMTPRSKSLFRPKHSI